jgi:hypothetical protein
MEHLLLQILALNSCVTLYIAQKKSLFVNFNFWPCTEQDVCVFMHWLWVVTKFKLR